MPCQKQTGLFCLVEKMKKKQDIAGTKSRMDRSRKPRAAANGLQAQKSAATQLQIVEGAIRCLIKYGYSDTTTPKIAAEAGVSRGAMMHHFPNRLEVIRAAITHLHNKRLKAFKRTVHDVPAGTDRLHALTRTYWRQVNHPLFTAFHELAVAARTDKDLAEILEPAQKEFYAQWHARAETLFPEWLTDRRNFELALHLVQNLLEGMAIGLQFRPPQAMTEMLLDYVEAKLRELAPAGALQDAPGADAEKDERRPAATRPA
ncbi:MAG: TetR/AcrR family transcriptional regulator [Alphaproteobacteria bacterium]|nr:MAG: TetR/AcrR family transcriptional regulator [Alphaproteobacteria bacterium]